MSEIIGDICGLCGETGADKISHPVHWPTERKPDTDFVHADCEKQECKKAFIEYCRKVGEDGIRKFLRSI